MPILNNHRYESLATHLAKGLTHQDAGVKAGYSERSARSQVCQILSNPSSGVKQRVEEIKKQGSERTIEHVAIDKAWVLQKLIGIVEECTKTKQHSPANKSLELIGKELGMFQDVIPREIFNLMMAQMGSIVAQYISDSAILEQIISGWERVSMAEPRQLKAGMLPAGPDKPSEPGE